MVLNVPVSPRTTWLFRGQGLRDTPKSVNSKLNLRLWRPFFKRQSREIQ
jgi:hypothetical protein